jgi:predicted RNA binding protein YcfA (HicA-like mRNA interferase family)
MKPLPFREVARRLEAAGFVRVSQKGSHVKFAQGARTVIVPRHREVAAGVLRSILRQAGLSEREFDLL